jgi:hypothetical protein
MDMTEEELEKFLRPRSVPELVSAFIADDYVWDEADEEPDITWHAILEILKMSLSEDQLALLAAGPLETVLSKHGTSLIDRVEQEARNNSKFNHLLGGVWRQGKPEEVWSRVEKARSEIW